VPGTWSDWEPPAGYEAAAESAVLDFPPRVPHLPAAAAVRPFDLLPPNEQARILAALDDADEYRPGRTVMLEGPRTWGNRYCGPAAEWFDTRRHVGRGDGRGAPDGTLEHRDAAVGTNRLVDPGRPGREPRRTDHSGACWIEAPGDDGPCDLCGGAIRPGSELVCPKCHASGKREDLLAAAAVAAFALEIDRERRGLRLDPDSGLVVPLDAPADPAASDAA
jgi:hypothetical protein